MDITPMPADTAALERLLAQVQEQNRLGLDVESFERWGTKDPAEVAQMAREVGYDAGKRAALASGLVALVERLRRENPRAIERWVEGHVRLLDDFIRRAEASPSSASGTGVFVARSEIEAWGEVARGVRTHVEGNSVYVHHERALYEAIFPGV